MTVHHLIAAPLTAGRKRSRKRRMTLARALRQADKAAVPVQAATLNADGSVRLELGDDGQNHRRHNEWDDVK
jgi:hypothetical protein